MSIVTEQLSSPTTKFLSEQNDATLVMLLPLVVFYLILHRACGYKECNILDFGAVGDGETFDTFPIQAAINKCGEWSLATKLRSIVIFPAERIFLTGSFYHSGGLLLLLTIPFTPPFSFSCRWYSGTIFLRSHVYLRIDAESRILGSPNLSDFPLLRERWYTILAERVNDVGIFGSGMIDGQSNKFVVEFNPQKNVMVSWNKTGQCLGDECRPRLVGFIECTNIEIRDVKLYEPAYWW